MLRNQARHRLQCRAVKTEDSDFSLISKEYQNNKEIKKAQLIIMKEMGRRPLRTWDISTNFWKSKIDERVEGEETEWRKLGPEPQRRELQL